MMKNLFRFGLVEKSKEQTGRLKQFMHSFNVCPTMAKYLKYCLCRWSNTRKVYHNKLKSSSSQLQKELDLKRTIRRSRMQTAAFLSLLSGHQTLFLTKMSRSRLVAESDDQNSSSSSALSSCSDDNNVLKESKSKISATIANKLN